VFEVHWLDHDGVAWRSFFHRWELDPVSLFRLESPRFGHGTYDAFCTFQAELPLDDCFTRVLAHIFFPQISADLEMSLQWVLG